MQTSLDHLPLRKRRELERVLAILFEEFDTAMKRGSSVPKQLGRILKVVLFGSYARGGWVEDRASGYLSDYDLLVVVNHDKLLDTEVWRFAEQRFIDEQLITKRIKTPTNLIVHTIGDINDQLAKGRYFFADIVKEGIALYDSGMHRFIDAKQLSEEDAHQEAQGHFDYWLPLAVHATELAKASITNGVLRDAAFMMHQSVERYYRCVLLVLTLYSPPTHNIKFLRSRAEDLDARLIKAWPRATKLERKWFELLKRAYVEARYSPQFEITSEELEWLAGRIEQLRTLVDTICREHLSPRPLG